MSSFTDKPTVFNNYIETTPVQAEVAVGMQKEQDFKAGIQKVQGYIDTIGGLDIMKNEGKDYVSNKLNEIKEGITKNLSGDFSDMRITSQIGGAVTHLYKDPIVQNQVSSTATYRKGISDLEAAKKEGKSSIANEWDFMNGAEKWLSDKSLDTTFNGKYKPFTNYRKNALDVIKSLTKDESITDSAFTTDSKGNLVITDAIVRKKLAGISPEKIQQALMAGLNPNDFQQMEIDGRYNYSSVTNSQFYENARNSYTEKIKFFGDQKTVLNNALSSTNSSVEKQTLQQKIESLDKTMTGLESEYNSIYQSLKDGNVDGAKAKLHTINFINGFSKAFSFTETSSQYETSPFVQAAQFRETKAMEWKKWSADYAQREKHFNINTSLKLKELEQKDKENELKKKELEGYGGLPAPIDQSTLPVYSLQRVIDEVNNGQKQIEDANAIFLKNQGKDKNWLNQQRDAWEKNPNGVDPLVANHFNGIAGKEREILAKQTMVTSIEADAKKLKGDINQFIPKDAPNLVYSTPSGQTTITPKDLVSFNERFRQYTSTPSIGGGTGGAGFGGITYNDAKAKKDLSPKEYLLYTIYKKNDKGEKLTQEEKTIVDHAGHYFKTVNTPNRQLIKEVDEMTSAEVTKRLTNMQGVSYAIPTATAAQKTSIGTVLASFADLADKQTGGLANSPNFSSSAARKLAADNDAKYTITVVEGTSSQEPMYEVSVTGTKASTSFVVTPEQKTAIFGNSYEASPAVRAFRPYQEQIRMMGGYTTNLNKSSDLNSAYLNKVDFPVVKNYGIKADIVTTSPGQYSLRLNIYDPITKEWKTDIPFPRNQLVSEEGMIKAMTGLTDAALFELINEKPATSTDLKQLESASKKPL